MQFTPARSLNRLQRDLDRSLGNLFPTIEQQSSPAWNDYTEGWSPAINIVETQGSFRIEIDLPGVEKDDVEISLHENVLTISGERKIRDLDESETSLRSERLFGSFSRALRLRADIIEKKITARLDNGVLFVELPKAEASKPTSIKIS